MKLRNKKTGKIINSYDLLTDKFILDLFSRDFDYFNSKLHKIEDEWEDYNEPKLFYVVDLDGEILPSDFEDKTIEKSKELGNYFETKEEAEKVVEKLKAWKRLKDKGFRFLSNKTIGEYGSISYSLTYPTTICEDKDLDLLFGGEE